MPAPMVPTAQDVADREKLVRLYGEHYWISHVNGRWMGTPRPRQADVLTSSNPEGLAYKLAQACAQREATDLSGLT